MQAGIEITLRGFVDAGQIAGAQALVWRDGLKAEVYVGHDDREAGTPVERDTVFRIASLSKPITSLAALILYDEGQFALEDPITAFAPEFERISVLRHPDAAMDDVVDAERPITFLDLLTHRSGLTYGAFHPGPLGRAYSERLGLDLDSHLSPDQWIAALAGLPLIDQPGAAFHYGVSTDLLGFLIERITGKPLAQVLAERIFAPLGMKETGFTLRPDQKSRASKLYGFNDAGALEARAVHPPELPAMLADRPRGLPYVSGGAGLWSTAADYLQFARLFVEEGAVDGRRLLKVGTLRRMTTNFLTPDQIASARTLGRPVFSGQGFGLGVAVVTDPDKAGVLRGKGGVGTVGWPGAYGGWWQADPTDGSVMIFLCHNALDPQRAARGLGLGPYAAIERLHALGSAPECP